MKKIFLIPLLVLFSCVMAWGANQAKIGEMEYATLSGALAAAQDGDEVLVLKNVTWPGGYLRVNKAIILNLNGYTLQSTDDETTAYTAVLAIFPGAGKSVTVKNGTIKSSTLKYTYTKDGTTTQKSKYVVWAYTGDITLQDLNVSGADYAVYNNGGANVTMEGNNVMHGQVTAFAFTKGSITIKDGVYSGSYGVQVNASASVNVTMEGGTINATHTGVLLNNSKASTFTLKEGTINAIQVGVNVAASNSFTMNGGEINVRGGKNYPYGVRNYGTTTINDGNITAITTVASYTGKALVNGSIVDKTYTPWAYAINGENNSTTIVNGGYLKAAKDEDGLYSSAIAVWTNASLTITNGTIESETYGITGNGGYSGTSITITGGSIISNIGGIYHPQGGELVIKGNPVVKAQNAIQLCAGTGLTGSITGGRFEAFGTDDRATKTGDGFIPDGAALSIVNRNYPGGTPSFTINGGVFLAQNQDALLAYTWSNNTASAWEAATSFLSVTEGIFSSDPTQYVSTAVDKEDNSLLYVATQVSNVTAYGADYENVWQVKENFTAKVTNDFTSANNEYVEVEASSEGATTDSEGKTTLELTEDQEAKYVKVSEDVSLVVKEDNNLNIGVGGLVMESSTSQVVLEPGAALTVGTSGIISTSTDNIVLESEGDKQATLLIDPDVMQNAQPLATVKITTKAKQISAAPYEYIWEYMALPVTQITATTKPENDFSGSLYEGESNFVTAVYTWADSRWKAVDSWTSLVPFRGYQLTNNSAEGDVTYTFKGHLVGNDNGTYDFASTGYGYFGNSYTAPIVISNFLSSLDQSIYERTVWVYDPDADTYVDVNPLTALLGMKRYGNGEAIKEIRSLQAFILNKANEGNTPATVDYRSAIWNNPRVNKSLSTSSAPARESVADGLNYTTISLSADGRTENILLIEGSQFSTEFDNGADAGKYMNKAGMNFYAAAAGSTLSTVATNDMEHTMLTFEASEAASYTISFSGVNADWMLRDRMTGVLVSMTENNNYTFTQDANTTVDGRFEVVRRANMPTAVDNVEESKRAGIYTIMGQYVGETEVFSALPAGVYIVDGVKVVK